MSCDQGRSSGNGGAGSGTGDSSEGEEQEESSSTSNLNTGNVNAALDKFRQQWKRELQSSPKHNDTEALRKSDEDIQDDTESKAKSLFLKGVEYEDTGKVFEAIHFYKRAVQLVPDIEFRLHESLKTIPRVRHETFGTKDGKYKYRMSYGNLLKLIGNYFERNAAWFPGWNRGVGFFTTNVSSLLVRDFIRAAPWNEYNCPQLLCSFHGAALMKSLTRGAETLAAKKPTTRFQPGNLVDMDIGRGSLRLRLIMLKFHKVTVNTIDELTDIHSDYSGALNKPERYKNDDQDDIDLSIQLQRKIDVNHLVCVPEHEQKSTHISALPTEIILCILRWVVSSNLDVRSLEMCSQVCRGLYLCARDPEIWKLICLKMWGVSCGRHPDPYLSWRDMYIKRPRLNFNGCYISKTSYIRHGENSFQDQFYRPCHLVEYYRYLRFFPDGIVLMLTSSEEPVQCVGQLRVRFPKLTGVLSGHYRLWKNTVSLLVKRQDIISNSNNYKWGKRWDTSDATEQTFQVELKINNHHGRKFVQLSWQGYSITSRNRNGLETTTKFDLPGNKYPPFWFSRVKSYTSEAESPLE